MNYFASLLISYPRSTAHRPAGTAAVSRSRSFPVFWASVLKAAMSSSHRSENLCLSSAGLPLDPGYSQSRSSPSNPCVLKYVIVVVMKLDLEPWVATLKKYYKLVIPSNEPFTKTNTQTISRKSKKAQILELFIACHRYGKVRIAFNSEVEWNISQLAIIGLAILGTSQIIRQCRVKLN